MVACLVPDLIVELLQLQGESDQKLMDLNEDLRAEVAKDGLACLARPKQKEGLRWTAKPTLR